MQQQLLDLASQHLPHLLLAYWALAAGSVVVTLLPLPVPQAFKDAVRLSAARGKLWHGKPAALGPLKDWAVPQAWFLHFYVLGSACNAAALLLYARSLTGSGGTVQAVPLLCLALFQCHLARRVLETACVMRYPRGAAMHGIAYLFGMSYYAVVPLSLLPAAWIQQQRWRGLQPWSAPAAAALAQQLGALRAGLTWVQLLGAAVFVGGNVLQAASHRGLAALSKGQAAGGSEQAAYKVPRGGAFELVSCPHYLGEIVIYAGLALASGGAVLPLLMLLWVTVNLVLAARDTHAWYVARFPGYTQLRRAALVPWLW